ncbi:hypothetical protein LCL87_08665 [Rhodococcus hoagii]|nr:hypothetical protein [Prescottella equi]
MSPASGRVEGPGATDIVVPDQCSQDHSDHRALIGSGVTARRVPDALVPAHPRPVP